MLDGYDSRAPPQVPEVYLYKSRGNRASSRLLSSMAPHDFPNRFTQVHIFYKSYYDNFFETYPLAYPALQDSLSADSKTLMLVCVSPVVQSAEESWCSLNFAARVRTVELGKV